jgi:hypothetical protein
VQGTEKEHVGELCRVLEQDQEHGRCRVRCSFSVRSKTKQN